MTVVPTSRRPDEGRVPVAIAHIEAGEDAAVVDDGDPGAGEGLSMAGIGLVDPGEDAGRRIDEAVKPRAAVEIVAHDVAGAVDMLDVHVGDLGPERLDAATRVQNEA